MVATWPESLRWRAAPTTSLLARSPSRPRCLRGQDLMWAHIGGAPPADRVVQLSGIFGKNRLRKLRVDVLWKRAAPEVFGSRGAAASHRARARPKGT